MSRNFNIYKRESCDKFIQVCDNPLVKQFKEIPPYTLEPNTGEVLNNSMYPKLVEVEPVNIQEYIDSFDDRDIYSMIKNLLTDPLGLQKAKLSENQVADISNMPTNIHEANDIINSGALAKDNLDPRISNVINDDEALKKVIKEIIDEQLKSEVKTNE